MPLPVLFCLHLCLTAVSLCQHTHYIYLAGMSIERTTSNRGIIHEQRSVEVEKGSGVGCLAKCHLKLRNLSEGTEEYDDTQCSRCSGRD